MDLLWIVKLIIVGGGQDIVNIENICTHDLKMFSIELEDKSLIVWLDIILLINEFLL